MEIKFVSYLIELKNKILNLMIFLLVMALMLASIGIVFFQIIFFLKNGEWLPIAFADLFGTALYEQKMKGVVKIFEWLPASITLFCLSLFFIILKVISKKA